MRLGFTCRIFAKKNKKLLAVYGCYRVVYIVRGLRSRWKTLSGDLHNSSDHKKAESDNRSFPSSSGPLYQNEVKCSAFDMEMTFYSHANKTHFHKKGWALSFFFCCSTTHGLRAFRMRSLTSSNDYVILMSFSECRKSLSKLDNARWSSEELTVWFEPLRKEEISYVENINCK